MDAKELAQRLADRIEALVEELLPAGRLAQRRYWRIGSLSGEQGQSLSVNLAGARRGRWKDFSTGQRGDALDLVAQIECAGELGPAFKWAKAWLGIEDDEVDPEERERRKSTAEKLRAERRLQTEQQDALSRRRARVTWDAVKPLVPGDDVDRYLKGRGLDLSVLGRAPAALRFAPSLWAGPGLRLPAMVAAISDGAGRFVAIHRTFLQRQGDVVIKAPIDGVKRTLGSYAGGSIKLWRGRSGKDWLHMPMGSTIVCAEGIEDALAGLIGASIVFPARAGGFAGAAVPLSELRVIAAVSLANIGNLVLPAQVSRLVILAQRDPPGSSAARMSEGVIRRLEAQGVEVLLLPPPAWGGIKDLADLVATSLGVSPV
jgi:hypothetical protein